MPHIYGAGARLTEVKSVSSAEDSAGTISFFDRGKYLVFRPLLEKNLTEDAQLRQKLQKIKQEAFEGDPIVALTKEEDQKLVEI